MGRAIEEESIGTQSERSGVFGFQRQLDALLTLGDASTPKALDAVFMEAVGRGASDVHLEPWDTCLMVRFRIDGMLHEAARLPLAAHARLVTRLKVLSRTVVYQKDIPQDGRIEADATPCGKAIRFSTFPTINGEKIVLRILNPAADLFHLDVLGFREKVSSGLRAMLLRSQGTILLTGPSSSGKTTTIYALLRELLASPTISARHVVSLEDPVEHRIDGIAQAEVKPHAGFTYEAALRALLRQDPEVIMLGEIRDADTARIAIQAGLTGHLVISTIHGGTAAGVFTRLLDMGIEPYLLASSITGVLAQRLVRKVCPACARPIAAPGPLAAAYVPGAPGDFKQIMGQGCDACQGIGYRGRMAIGELLMMDERFAESLMRRERTSVLHETAKVSGMMPVVEDGLSRVWAGETTLEELARVLPPSFAGVAAHADDDGRI